MAKLGRRVVVGLMLLSLLLPSAACADGFRNPFQSAVAVAQGNAFAAQADDASAIFYNPAGMTQLHGVHQLAGVAFVNVHTRFRSLTSETTENAGWPVRPSTAGPTLPHGDPARPRRAAPR